jgi:ankyrin repeat protein
MHSLGPLNVTSASAEKLEIEQSKENPLETQLFLKTIGGQGQESTSIGKWDGKKFNLSKNLKDADLQQVAVKLFNKEVACTPEQEVSLCKELIDRGIPLNIKGTRTPLHNAAFVGDLELMKKLVDEQGLEINAKDKYGETPLFYAIRADKKEIVEWLLSNGADANSVSHDGQTPLHYAVMYKNAAVAELLIKGGANKDALDAQGSTPLHLALSWGRSDAMISLLITKSNINLTEGTTPLLLAISSGKPEIVEALLKNGADPNIPETTGLKSPPLHYAVNQPSDKIATLLLDHGAKIDAVNSKGEQAIHQTIFSPTTETPSHLERLKTHL